MDLNDEELAFAREHRDTWIKGNMKWKLQNRDLEECRQELQDFAPAFKEDPAAFVQTNAKRQKFLADAVADAVATAARKLQEVEAELATKYNEATRLRERENDEARVRALQAADDAEDY